MPLSWGQDTLHSSSRPPKPRLFLSQYVVVTGNAKSKHSMTGSISKKYSVRGLELGKERQMGCMRGGSKRGEGKGHTSGSH